MGLGSLRLDFRGLCFFRVLSANAATSAPPSAAARSLHPSIERARPRRHRSTPTRHRTPAAERGVLADTGRFHVFLFRTAGFHGKRLQRGIHENCGVLRMTANFVQAFYYFPNRGFWRKMFLLDGDHFPKNGICLFIRYMV